MAQEIDLEKCNFRNFRSSVTLILTLTLDRVEVTLVRIRGQGLPTHQIRSKLEKLFCGQTDVRMDRFEFQFITSSMNLINVKKHQVTCNTMSSFLQCLTLLGG